MMITGRLDPLPFSRAIRFAPGGALAAATVTGNAFGFQDLGADTPPPEFRCPADRW